MAGPKKSSTTDPNANLLQMGQSAVARSEAYVKRDSELTAAGIPKNLPFGMTISQDIRERMLTSQQQAAAKGELDKKAKEMGFADEADRVAKVSKIIDAFGKARKGSFPAALSGLGPKTGYAGNVPGIMTKAK